MNWNILLIGFALLGLSAIVQAAYSPYLNYWTATPYGVYRPYVNQFHYANTAPIGPPNYVYGYYPTYYYPSYPVTFAVPSPGICYWGTGCHYR
ncbi:MAG: hypothetical protein V1777_04140 [Candidatus Micrarchaeota archaeon]